MAEITRERTGQMVRTVFAILVDSPEGKRASAVIEEAKKRLPPTDFELSLYPKSGLQRYDKILRFSTIAPVKAGWLVKSKGTWIITEEGKAAYEKFFDAKDLVKEAGRLYRLWKISSEPEPEDDEEAGTSASAGATLEEAEESAWAEISEYLHNVPPYEFQALVAALLEAMGYFVAWMSPPGKDGGLDIVAYTDPLGAKGPRIKTQVKRLKDQKVDVNGLRSFMAVLSSQDVGIFVSTSGFTSDAEREARHQENRQITLIDLARLFDLWVEHYSQLGEADRQRLPLRPVYFLAPN